MKDTILKASQSLFSIFILLAVAGGGIVFMMFVIGIIIGGPTGNSLAVSAKNTVMPIFIRSAALAVFAGLIYYYTSGEHTLTMDDDKEE